MSAEQRLENNNAEQIEEIPDSESQESHRSQFSEITDNNVSENEFQLSEVSLPSKAAKIHSSFLDEHDVKPTPHADADVEDWRLAGCNVATNLWKKALD